jgi:hypothetical protein
VILRIQLYEAGEDVLGIDIDVEAAELSDHVTARYLEPAVAQLQFLREEHIKAAA